MKHILLLLCVVGLGLGGQCFEKETPPDPAEQAAAFEKAKTEAQDVANKAVGQAIFALTKAAGVNTQRIDTLKSIAEGALKQAESATTEEEANKAKEQAQDAYNQLVNITNVLELDKEEEDTGIVD